MHALPIPRATTAAWLVMPPRAVRMPRAAFMPWMSSGDVSMRTRMTGLPCPARRSASSALKAMRPGLGGPRLRHCLRVERGVEELLERARVDAEDRFILRDELLRHHVDG